MQIHPSTADVTERGWSLELSPETIEAISGVHVPSWVRARGPLDAAPLVELDAADSAVRGVEVEIEAAYDPPAGHYVMRRLEVPGAEGAEVTGALLRQIAPLSLMRWVLPRTFLMDLLLFNPRVAQFVTPEGQPPHGDELDSDEVASTQDAATIYRLAEILRYPPAKAVADALGLQTRTATNWIKRAKEQGLLND